MVDGTGIDVLGHPARLVAVLDRAAADLMSAGIFTIVLGGAALAGLSRTLTVPARFVDCIDAATRQAMCLLVG